MSGLVLDAGALIAIDRGDREVILTLQFFLSSGSPVRSNAMVVAQVWRDARGRQARLAKSLRSVDIRAVAPATGRAGGLLLAAAGLEDAIDATVALLAEDGDTLLTSDPADLRRLLAAAGIRAAVIPCAAPAEAGARALAWEDEAKLTPRCPALMSGLRAP